MRHKTGIHNPAVFIICIYKIFFLYYQLTKSNNQILNIMEKFLNILGWIATGTAMLMYVSYIPQITSNLQGMKGDFLQPLVAGINCTLWVGYGFLKPKKDWPIIVANTPGIIFGFTAAFTAVM